MTLEASKRTKQAHRRYRAQGGELSLRAWARMVLSNRPLFLTHTAGWVALWGEGKGIRP